jgi:hypothetical protein
VSSLEYLGAAAAGPAGLLRAETAAPPHSRRRQRTRSHRAVTWCGARVGTPDVRVRGWLLLGLSGEDDEIGLSLAARLPSPSLCLSAVQLPTSHCVSAREPRRGFPPLAPSSFVLSCALLCLPPSFPSFYTFTAPETAIISCTQRVNQEFDPIRIYLYRFITEGINFHITRKVKTM